MLKSTVNQNICARQLHQELGKGDPSDPDDFDGEKQQSWEVKHLF